MRIYLFTRKALVYALAAGRTVWCAESGEGWQLGVPSLRCAKHTAEMILRYADGTTFFVREGAD